MGESTELTAKEWGVTREAHELAYQSHHRAAAAWQEGFIRTWSCRLRAPTRTTTCARIPRWRNSQAAHRVRPDGERLDDRRTPLTDGAASVLLASEDWARERGLPVLAYLRFGQQAAVDFVDRDGLLMAPAFAVSNMLKLANLSFADFDFFEIHEAFAAQTLATPRPGKTPTSAANVSAGVHRWVRPQQNEHQGRQYRDRSSLRGHRRAHPRRARQAAERARLRTRGGMGVSAIVEK